MNYTQENRPMKLNMDKSRKDLSETEAFYLLNHERYVNVRGGGKINGTLGKTTPPAANYPACEMQQPNGENYTVGTYRSPITNELYSWHFNSHGDHYILRISAERGCEVVLYHPCLQVSEDPRHAMTQWRAYLKVDKLCKNQHGKQLIWTDGKFIGQVDVEASIATNSFSTDFFKAGGDWDDCELIQMYVPNHCRCIHAEFLPLKDEEIGLSNKIIDKPFQFMYRHIYYDGRASEWSDRSQPYYQDTKGCFDSVQGFSRCLKLRIPIGNPLVEKIEVAYSNDGLNWFSIEVIEKYKAYNSTHQYWYERTLSEMISGGNYSGSDDSFDYLFCNDKQCDPIDTHQVERVHNPFPREAQGLISIKDSLGFYNYKKGTCPIDRFEAEKFEINLACEEAESCIPEYVTVTVRAIIHNNTKDKNQFVFRMGAGGEDDPSDPAHFGGLNHIQEIGAGDTGGGFEVGYDQVFDGKARNFIAFIEGTDIWGEMKQYHANKNFQARYEIGVVPDMGNRKTQRKWDNDTDNDNFFYQEVKLKVRKGTKGFIRLVSHHEETGSGSAQNTSTFVIGTMNIGGYQGKKDINDLIDWERREIFFTACNGDVELMETFVIRDNATDKGLRKKSSSFHGYITDLNGEPVDGAYITTQGPFIPYARADHNGFYHFLIEPGEDGPINFDVWAENAAGGAWGRVHSFTVTAVSGENVSHDVTISDFEDYRTNFYAKARVRIVDCNGVGVGGVRISLSGSHYRSTKPDGFAEFNIRNYKDHVRNLRALVVDHKACFVMDCGDGCNICLPETSTNVPVSFMSNTPNQPPIITLPTMIVNKKSAFINKRGLKNGGRYGFGFVVEGDQGFLSDVNEVAFIDIPRAQQNKDVRYCALTYSATRKGKLKLPSEARCLKIVRTKNLNPYELQWSVDKIERIAGGKIKLTIQSLNDYNAQYNFKTNTKYGYLKGDRVEFIRNGDGKLFDIQTNGLLNYLTLSPYHDVNLSENDKADADFFNQILIEDDGRLENLKEGAIVEFQRNADCSLPPTYYEICATIPVVDGELLYEEGAFTSFDTYLVSRVIGQQPSQTFEHHSPSDFWGERIDDTGKGYLVDKYANEKRMGRNITINAPNQYNYFGDLEKTFDAPEQGDLTAVWITDGKIILAIGENDNFLAQAADDLLRVGSDGIIRALPADAIISPAEPKLRGKFGCQYESIGSVFFGDGFATWYDANNNAYVKHDYSEAKDVSLGQVKSYFVNKGQLIGATNRSDNNLLNHFRFTTGRNSVTGAIYTTIKALRNDGFNSEKSPYLKPNETIVFYPNEEDWGGFISPTPEAYGSLDLFDGGGCAFVSYLHGIPYIHPIISEKFNEFYGVAVDRVVGITLNKFREKEKIGLAVELQDDMMWYLHQVTTNRDGFVSEVPPIRWKQDKGRSKWNAAFLFNSNSKAGLYGREDRIGESTKGEHIDCVFVRDNTDQLKYGTISPEKQRQYDELDLIIFKFAVSEQTGYTENL